MSSNLIREEIVLEEHIELICREAADMAVKQVFAHLGVDVDKPESIEEFRADLRFGKQLRKAVSHGVLAMVGAIVLAAMAAAMSGVVAKITGKL